MIEDIISALQDAEKRSDVATYVRTSSLRALVDEYRRVIADVRHDYAQTAVYAINEPVVSLNEQRELGIGDRRLTIRSIKDADGNLSE